MIKRLEGLIAASYTPMHADGRLNLDQVGPMVEYLISRKMDGIYVCGSTGEGVSLTGSERKDVAKAYVDAVAGRVPVIIQVGHNSVFESRELAEHAQKIGADMISANSPSYFKPTCVESLVDCMAELTAGAPELPFYYYHIPALTGAPLNMVEFLEKGAEKIPTLVGIKFSDLKVFEYQDCLQYQDGKYDILWGCDEMMLSALAVGCKGSVGSTFNIAPALYRNVISAYEAGDMETAAKNQYRSVQLVKVVLRHAPLHTSMKAILKIIGLDCGPVRVPQAALEDGVTELIRTDLEQIGYFDWSGAV